MKNNRLGFGIGTLIVLLIVFFALLFRQAIIDQFVVWSFTPSAAVSKLADSNDFTSQGLKTFYASRPEIDDRDKFNTSCGTHEEATAVLGCYVGNRIYIFAVDNSELDGIEEVTAAHEMLHAAYHRLSLSARDNVDALLTAEASKLEANKSFKDRIAVYSKLPKSQFIDELHSVIGTEVADISPALESYYAQYFKDRASIVAMHQSYAGVFTKLQNEANALVAELNQLAVTINQRTKNYNTATEQLSRDIVAFNTRAERQGGFGSQAEFNAARAELVARTTSLEASRNSLNRLIETYRADSEKLSAMEVHIDNLNASIDSNLRTVPKVNNGV